MWQEIIVGACVVFASLFLAWRWLPIKRKKTAGCGSGCADCSSSAKSCNTEESGPGKS